MQNEFLNFTVQSISNLAGSFVINYDEDELREKLKYYFNLKYVKAISVIDDSTEGYFLVIINKMENL